MTASVYNAVIIGGGPAGLFAAIRLAELCPGARIAILERKEKPGRKLLLSGSGQCNLTHAGGVEDFLTRYGGGPKPESAARFLRPALHYFPAHALLAWFGARGVEFETEDNGKIFPLRRKASEILKVLDDARQSYGISIELQCRITRIEQFMEEGAPIFTIRAEDGREFLAPVALIATGGASYPGTGSTGDGYALAAALGHHIEKPRPALTPVFIRDFPLAGLSGLSFRNARIVARRGAERAAPDIATSQAGVKLWEGEGELLITHTGLSGPLILDRSRRIEAGDLLEINFVDCAPETYRARLDAALQSAPRRLARTLLAETGLTRHMAERFCDLAGIGEEATAASMNRRTRDTLCRFACAFPCTVGRLGDFDIAMVTAGGVRLAEVQAGTMESRLAQGLYFSGEVLDIDGDSGGFNLQAAFSTAALAAGSMAARLNVARLGVARLGVAKPQIS